MCARAGIGIGIGLSGGGKQREMEGRGRVRSKGFKNRKEEEKKEIKKKKERERKERQEKSKSRDQKRLSYLQEAALQTLTESYALFFSSTLIFPSEKAESYTHSLSAAPPHLCPPLLLALFRADLFVLASASGSSLACLDVTRCTEEPFLLLLLLLNPALRLDQP